jgi:hypothetical protein
LLGAAVVEVALTRVTKTNRPQVAVVINPVELQVLLTAQMDLTTVAMAAVVVQVAEATVAVLVRLKT